MGIICNIPHLVLATYEMLFSLISNNDTIMYNGWRVVAAKLTPFFCQAHILSISLSFVVRTKCFGLCSSAKGLKFLEMQLSPNSKTVKQGRTCTELSCSSCFRKNLKTILYCHNHCPIDSLSVLERYIFTRG